MWVLDMHKYWTTNCIFPKYKPKIVSVQVQIISVLHCRSVDICYPERAGPGLYLAFTSGIHYSACPSLWRIHSLISFLPRFQSTWTGWITWDTPVTGVMPLLPPHTSGWPWLSPPPSSSCSSSPSSSSSWSRSPLSRCPPTSGRYHTSSSTAGNNMLMLIWMNYFNISFSDNFSKN